MLDLWSSSKIVDPHNYLLMTIDGKLLRGLFEHERLKPEVVKTDKAAVSTQSALKGVMNLAISLSKVVQVIISLYPIVEPYSYTMNHFRTLNKVPKRFIIQV